MEVEEETADREAAGKWVVQITQETMMGWEALEDGTTTITIGLAAMISNTPVWHASISTT
jgi:hypothetical protein